MKTIFVMYIIIAVLFSLWGVGYNGHCKINWPFALGMLLIVIGGPIFAKFCGLI